MNKEQPELTALQLAYNQGIEDAMCAIRAESQGGGYWAATYINAIARRCSPFWHVAAKFTAPTYDQAVQAITDIRGARESHVQWAAHLRDTKREDCKGCDDHAAHIGDAAYHDEWIAKYDNVIYVLAHAPFTDAAATTSPETPVGGEVNQLIQDLASFPFDTLMDENAPRIAIIGSVSTLRHMQARAQEIVAAPVQAAGDDEGKQMNTITFGDPKNVANPDVSCPKCGGTKPTCCRCPDDPALTWKQFIDEFTQATIEAHVGFHHEKPYHECNYDVCVKRRVMIDEGHAAAALRSGGES